MQAEHLHTSIKDKIDELRENNKIATRLYKHIEDNYVNNQNKRETNLQRTIAVLDNILVNNHPKVNITYFKKCLQTIRQFSNDTPRIKGNRLNDNDVYCVIEASKIGKNGKIYKYETGFFTKGITEGHIGKKFYLSHRIFDVSQTIHENEVYTNEKQQYRNYQQYVGDDLIDKRIYDDHISWNEFVKRIGNDETLAFIMGLESNSTVVRVKSVSAKDNAVVQEEFKDRNVADSLNEKYIDTKFIRYNIDLKSRFLIEPDYTTNIIDGLKQSCFFKSLFTTYKTSFDKYHSSLQQSNPRSEYRLTKELVSETCLGKPYDGRELNMTILEASRFFVHFHLGMRVFDPNGSLLFSEIPDVFHSKIRPRTINYIYKNNHIISINDTKQFEQHLISRERSSCQYDSSYVFKKYGMIDSCDYVMSSSIAELTENVQTLVKNNSKNIHVLWKQNNMNEVLLHFVRNGYTPSINIRNGMVISGISFNNLYYENVNIKLYVGIIPVSHGDEEVLDGFENIEMYQNYKLLEKNIFDLTIIPKYLSGFNNDTLKILKEYSVSIPSGSIKNIKDDDNIPFAIDMCKHYASCLANTNYLFSISPFDNFKVETNVASISRDKLYIVHVLETCDNPIYKMKDITLMFHDELCDLEIGIDVDIIASIRLILHENLLLPELIKEVFSATGKYNEIPMELRKGMLNRAIGEFGRKKNRSRKACVFKNYNDALLFMQQHDEEPSHVYQLEKDVWLVKSVYEHQLKEGFIPINEMIKSMSRHTMSNIYKKLKSLDCEIVGFKTDAIYFTKPSYDIELKNHIDELNWDECNDCCIGKAKLFQDNSKSFPRVSISRTMTDKFIFEYLSNLPSAEVIVKKSTVSSIENELEPNSIIIADAGCGKTYTLINYLKSKHGKSRVLVVTCWNSQAKNVREKFKVNAVTWHHLRGAKLDDTINFKSTEYNVSNYSCIVFDEIMLFDHNKLRKLPHYMNKHNHIEYYATGDPKQLEAIGDVIDNNYKLKLITSNNLFPNVFELSVNLRVIKEDREKLKEITDFIYSDSFVNLPDLIEKYFKEHTITIDQLKENEIKRGVALYNTTTGIINRIIHEKLPHSRHRYSRTKVIDGVRYHYNDVLICKKYVNNKINVNYEYVITSMNNKLFTLKDIITGDIVKVSLLTISNNFSFSYCNTVHSSQGNTINEKYVICDIHSRYITRNWIVSAITRCSRLSDVYFLSSFTLKNIDSDKIISSYFYQDKLKNKDSNITQEWLYHNYYNVTQGICRYCGVFMNFEKHNPNKVTVNRLNNDIGHVLGNVELCCWKCNNKLH